MEWNKIEFDRDQLATGKALQFIKRFADCLSATHTPDGLAMFHFAGSTDVRAVYYFPPNAAKYCGSLLDEFCAEEVREPAAGSLQVAIGPAEAIDHWF